MSAMASQITGVSLVCSTVCSGADERKHQSSASLALVRGIHRSPVNSPHKGPVTRKIILFASVTSSLATSSPAMMYLDQRKHQSSASLALVRGIHRSPVNSPHKGPVTRKIILFASVTSSLATSSPAMMYLDQRKHQSSASLAFTLGQKFAG